MLESRSRDTRCTDYRPVLVLDPVPGPVGPHLRLGRVHRVGRKVAVGFGVDCTVVERAVLEVLYGQVGTRPLPLPLPRPAVIAAAAVVVAAAVAAAVVGCSRTAVAVVDAVAVTEVYCDCDSDSEPGSAAR